MFIYVTDLIKKLELRLLVVLSLLKDHGPYSICDT